MSVQHPDCSVYLFIDTLQKGIFVLHCPEGIYILTKKLLTTNLIKAVGMTARIDYALFSLPLLLELEPVQ